MAPEAKAFFDEMERATAPIPFRPGGELRPGPGVVDRLKRWGRNMASHPDAMFDPNQNPAAVVLTNKPVAAAMSALDLTTGPLSRTVGSLVERGQFPGLGELFGKDFQQTPTADRAVTNAVATSPLYQSVMKSAFGRAMVTNPIIGAFGDPDTVAAIPPAIMGTTTEALTDPDTILTGVIGAAGALPGRVASKLASPDHLRARAAGEAAEASAWRAAREAEIERGRASHRDRIQAVQTRRRDAREAQKAKRAEEAARAAEEARRNAPIRSMSEMAEEKYGPSQGGPTYEQRVEQRMRQQVEQERLAAEEAEFQQRLAREQELIAAERARREAQERVFAPAERPMSLEERLSQAAVEARRRAEERPLGLPVEGEAPGPVRPGESLLEPPRVPEQVQAPVGRPGPVGPEFLSPEARAARQQVLEGLGISDAEAPAVRPGAPEAPVARPGAPEGPAVRPGAPEAPAASSRVLVHDGQREVAAEVLQVRDRPGEPGGRTIVRHLEGPDAGAVRSYPASQVRALADPQSASSPVPASRPEIILEAPGASRRVRERTTFGENQPEPMPDSSAAPALRSQQAEPAVSPGRQVLVQMGNRQVTAEVLRVRDTPGKPGGRVVVRHLDGPDAGAVKNYPARQVRAMEEPRPAAGPAQTPDTLESRRPAMVGTTNNTRQDLTFEKAQEEARSSEFRGFVQDTVDYFEGAGYRVTKASPQVGTFERTIENSVRIDIEHVDDLDRFDRLVDEKRRRDGQVENIRMVYDGGDDLEISWTLPSSANPAQFQSELIAAGFGDNSLSIDGLSGSVILEAREALAKNPVTGKDAVETLNGLVRDHGGTHTAEFGTVRSLRDGSISRVVEPQARPLDDGGRPPGGRTETPREARTPGNSDSGQARGSNDYPAEDARPSTPDTLEASRPGATATRVAQGPAETPPPAVQASPGPSHRPTPGQGDATPGAIPLAEGPIPDVKSQQGLVRGLAEALGVRFQYGRAVGMKKRNPGRYHSKRNLVEATNSGDLQTMFHEAGHALDVNHGFRGSLSPQALAEVERLGDPAQTPGSMSSWTKHMPQDRKQMEGLAELLRLWFTDEARVKRIAPQAAVELNILLDHTGDTGRKLRKVHNDHKLWQESPSAAKMKAQIVFDRPGTPLTVDHIITSVYDQFHPIALLSDFLRDAFGVKMLRPSEDPYILARLIKGLPKVVESFLGTRSKKTGAVQGGAVDFSSRELRPGSRSLKAILEPLEDNAEKTSKFITYLVARRAQEYLDRGLHPGFHPDDVAQTLKDLDSPEFQQMAQDIYKWNDEVLQYAVDGGFITEEAAAIWREMHRSYVPIHRIMELGANEFPELGGGTGRGLQATDPQSFKKVRGMRDAVASTEIVNPLESMIQNAMSIITATERNRIGQVLAKHWDDNVEGIGAFYREVTPPTTAIDANLSELVSARKLRKELEALGADLKDVSDETLRGMLGNFEGVISRKKGIPDAGTNTIRVKMPDGKVRMFELQPELYKAWTALEHEEVPGCLRYVGLFAQILRAGATTLSLPFVLRNVNRDSFTGSVISRIGAKPYVNIIQGLGAMFDEAKVREWLLHGGGQSMEANLYTGRGFERAVLEVASGLSPEARKNTWLPWRMLKQLREQPAVWARRARRNAKTQAGRTAAAIAEGFAESPIDMLGRLAEGSEMTVRLAEFENAKKKLRQEHPDWSDADVNARAAFESRDLMDFAMSGSGWVRHIRRIVPFFGARLTGNYRLYRAFKEDPKGTAARGLFWVTAPTLALYAWNQTMNGENYNQLPQRERDTFWHLAFGQGPEDFIRIPKPFLEGALFGTTIERFAQFAWKQDPEAFRGHLDALAAETLPVNVMDPLRIPGDLSGPGISTLIEIATNHDFFRDRNIVPDYMRNDYRNPRPNWMESNEYTTATAKATARLARKVGLDWSPMVIDHVVNSLTATAGSEAVRGLVDPVVHRLTGEELPKSKPRKWLGFVYTENISESEDRFRRLFKKVGDRAAEAEALGKPFKDAALWSQLKAANKQVLGIRKQLRESDDETERRRLLDELREITSEFTPAVGPNVLSR